MSLNKEKIFIDVDETMARTVEDWVYPFTNAEFWTNFSFETTTDYRDIFWNVIQENWVPITLDKKIEIFKWAVAKDIWKNQIRPVEWSVKKILELSGWFDMDMLTARHPDLVGYTADWARHHFNWAVRRVLSSNCYFGGKVSKLDICNNEWVRIMIEDDLDYALELAKGWVKVFLLRKPWNEQRKENHRNIERVDWWSEIRL